ncbi:MAG: FixH family protein [Campylobacterota bacterium]|nr:FixH family protein [Campylobacterota bacterium]
MNKSNGRIWPYAIGISIILVFGACIATIVVATTLPVEKSDQYMMYYQEADANANELIKARIAFDKKYKIEYITDKFCVDDSIIKYKVTDLNSNPVNNAKLLVVVTRPNNHKHDQEILNPTVKDGVYQFSSIKLEKEGRWDIMAKINIDNLQRFYNVKVDTRDKKVSEY